MNRTLFRFADFQLAPAARELRQDGRRVALPPKSLECLIYLIEQRDRAVGRDELISAVWGRVDVSDALLAQTLLRARRAVGDTGNEQSSIRTVPRFGYQWVAPTQAIETAAAAATAAVIEPSTAPAPAAVAPAQRRARWPLLVAAALLGLAALFLFWRRAAEVPAAAAADLIVVAPVALPGAGADAAWIRLGVMDYIAARLRGAGLVVLPSERVAGLVAERGDESPQQLHSRLRRASGAGLLLQPEARQRSDGSWQLLLQPVAERAGTAVSGRGASPLAAADAAVAELLSQLGRAPAATTAASPDAAAERLQQLDAAMLEGDLAAARSLIAAADPAARAAPALRVREGQLAFRAGNLEATEAIFGALQANLGQLPPELQAQALAGLGALAVRRGQYAEAERRYAESLAVLGPDGRQDLIGNGFTGRGVARAAQGQHELAAADLARARVALERAGDAPGVASVDTNLGLLQSRSGKPATALQSFERAIAVFERYDVRDSLAASLLGLARTLQLLADNAAALGSARRAAELGRQLENPVLLRNIAQQLADTLIASGRLTEAAGVIDSLPTAPTPAEGLAELRLRLALEQGRHAEALRLGAAAPATDATAQ